MSTLPTRFVLVRHGHTPANGSPEGMRMSGWTDVPLSDLGRHEAALAARALRGRGAFAALYASPLARARETASAVQASVGLPLEVHPGLMEIFCGVVDGWRIDEVQSRHPAAWRRNAEEVDEHFRWPGGESNREFRARCLRTLRDIARRHRGQRVLLVTHAGFISQALGSVLGISCARWSAYRPANASMTTLDWRGGRGVVVDFDDHAHLRRAVPDTSRSRLRAG